MNKEINKKCSFCQFWPAQSQWKFQFYLEQVNYCSYRCQRADLCLVSETQKKQWREAAKNSWKEYEEQENRNRKYKENE